AMSFADLAQHLLDADSWMARKLEDHSLASITGSAGSASPESRADYERMLNVLEQSGRQRSELIAALSAAQLRQKIPDDRFGGTVSVWWVIVRGNLDHEIHHRGQIAAWLPLARR
ncbi:MAG: DinB family protein, partial [bacterium]